MSRRWDEARIEWRELPNQRRSWSARCVSFVGLAVVVLTARFAHSADKPTLNAPRGFEAVLFADDDLAHDIQCLTIDARGRITVAGGGEIKLLIDADGDGIADRADVFAKTPSSGVQGMYWHGPELLAVGGDGLTLYRDADGDGRADSKTELLLRVRTGGEHHAHAIQQGPDGWWYLIAGNDTGMNEKHITLPNSPVKQPQAGVLYRMKPDIQSGGEVVAHGMRNAYDFAFGRSGDAFTYDSDDERDASLPWYRPTRVFQLLPGSHAGWETRSWKRPDEFLDMPPVVASAGRGSPTGVVCYRHRQFPEKYRDGLFILDWTFGRILALPLVRNGSAFVAEPELFLSSAGGDLGFAPTDAEVGPDGSLYVSVGGRGTRGSVWRVTYRDGLTAAKPAGEPASDDERLAQCLNAPQPLSSWSRAEWIRLAKQLGREPFWKTANDASLRPSVRVRAIEVITERFGGLTTAETLALAKETPAEVRARAIWSLGRTHANPMDAQVAAAYLADTDSLVVRFCLEALLSAEKAEWSALLPSLAKALSNPDRFVRVATARLIARLNDADAARLAQLADNLNLPGRIALGMGLASRNVAGRREALRIGLQALEEDSASGVKLQAARLVQLALGDVVPKSGMAAAFEGFTPRTPLADLGVDLAGVSARLANQFPNGQVAVDRELSRALAMLAPGDSQLFDRIVAKLSKDSDPIDDIHYLIVAARLPVGRTAEQSASVARTLVRLEPKLVARHLNQDLNWDDRVGELFDELRKRDAELSNRLLEEPSFGLPSHVVFSSRMPRDLRPQIITRYATAIAKDAEYAMSNEVVLLLGDSTQPEHRELVRQQFEQFNLRGAVLSVLARNPVVRDREKFVDGLEESRLDVLTACLEALGKLPTGGDAAEQFALLRLLRRLGTDPKEFSLREQVVRLLAREHGRDFGFVFGSSGHRPQPEAIESWTKFLADRYPDEAKSRMGGDAETMTSLKSQLAGVDWSAGDVGRGQKLFEKRGCAQCHGGRRGLGPDLAGATRRFSRDDLFVAIALPNRDVSPLFQTTLIETKHGQVHTGLIVYESVEGVLLRNANNQTVRIERAAIESRRTLPISLMPTGLLKDLTPTDHADLLAYLKSLATNP